jgi:hypothetical protein
MNPKQKKYMENINFITIAFALLISESALFLSEKWGVAAFFIKHFNAYCRTCVAFWVSLVFFCIYCYSMAEIKNSEPALYAILGAFLSIGAFRILDKFLNK